MTNNLKGENWKTCSRITHLFLYIKISCLEKNFSYTVLPRYQQIELHDQYNSLNIYIIKKKKVHIRMISPYPTHITFLT